MIQLQSPDWTAEPQGWYGLFDIDASLLTRVRAHAAERCTGLTLPCAA